MGELIVVNRFVWVRILLLHLLFVSCDSVLGKPHWMGTVTDSAGIAIVSNPETPLRDPVLTTGRCYLLCTLGPWHQARC